MHVPAYEDVSNRMHRGVLALPGLGSPTDRPTWIMSWTDQASSLLDQILVHGEYRKVDCCDTCNSKIFMEAYEDATFSLHGYLVVDCDSKSPCDLKLRTNIFPGEKTICYLKKSTS